MYNCNETRLDEFRGFSSFFIGNMSDCCFGDEKKYLKCCGFSSGIGDIDWWIKEELQKLTGYELDELESFLIRNKNYWDSLHTVVSIIAKKLNVEEMYIYRLPWNYSKVLVDNMYRNDDVLEDIWNSFLYNEKICKTISFPGKYTEKKI